MTAPKKKLLITGLSGFLGWHLVGHCPPGWQIGGTYRNHAVHHPGATAFQADLTNSRTLSQLIQTWRPDAVIHAAALSNPNTCTLEPELSHQINVQTSLELAEICRREQLPLLFTSTDLVFDGESAPYAEKDQPVPVNLYGQHKLEAETGILQIYPAATIVRLPLLYGWPGWGSNFLPQWVQSWRNAKTVFAFTDEYRTPLSGRDAAEGLYLLLKKEVTGIWHLAGPERLSRYETALQIAEIFDLPLSSLQASLRADVQMPAARPKDVSLSADEVIALGFRPRPLAGNLIQVSRFSKF